MASETTSILGREQLLKNAEASVRSGFVRKVYGILSAQLLLTTAIAVPFTQMTVQAVQSHTWILYVSMAVLVATMCSMMCCANMMREFPTNYIILLVLTSSMGVLVGFISAMYTWQSVCLAAGITVGIFLSMTLYAWTTKTDFTGAGPYLFAALSAMCLFGFTISILSLCGVNVQWAMMAYDFLGVLLFTFYIVFDTQLIMGGNHKVQFSIDDYCLAALNLYLDIINLFLHILSLLGDRK